mmetsp:Transcript_20882/g.59637  ORF Transcript_20882/g.59637 Transcript_20882/m.59637 type:complete len:89 (-) Transcript_20882:14-280(-)
MATMAAKAFCRLFRITEPYDAQERTESGDRIEIGYLEGKLDEWVLQRPPYEAYVGHANNRYATYIWVEQAGERESGAASGWMPTAVLG